MVEKEKKPKIVAPIVRVHVNKFAEIAKICKSKRKYNKSKNVMYLFIKY